MSDSITPEELPQPGPGAGGSRNVSFQGGEKKAARSHLISRIPTRMEMKTLTHLAKRPALSIEFKDLTYSVRSPLEYKTKEILKGLSGKFCTGELTAILGSSGAGKSTLMNILAGYVTIGVSGTIETNGHPRQMKHFNKLTSYIMQDDLLQPFLTVIEAMETAAHLKLGNELSAEDKKKSVDEILNTLGLANSKATRVEKLSGGQRKRLAIALELVNNPPVIFLDEPTTGLDIVSTKQLLTLLKKLARQGRTIICTLHQPSASIFETLDLIYVMSAGKCVYHGTHNQLVPFIAQSINQHCPTTHNPADFIMEIIGDESRLNPPKLTNAIQNGKLRLGLSENEKSKPENLTKLCRMETIAVMPKVYNPLEESNKNANIDFPTSFFEQFWILTKRRCLQLTRNKTMLWIMFAHHVMSAALVGIIFQKVGNDANRPFENFKFIMSCVVFFMYTHVMCNVLLYPFEVKRLKMEYFNRWYGLKSYSASHLITSIVPQIILGFIFVLIVYLMTDQPLDVIRFLWFYATGVLLGLASEGLGLTIGATFRVMNGCVVGPVTVVPLLAVAVYGMGFGRVIEPIMQIFMSISYLRYGVTGFTTALYDEREPLLCPQDITYCHYKNPHQLVIDVGMDGCKAHFQIIALICFAVVYRITAYIALRHQLTVQFSNKLLTFISKILKHR